VSQAEVVYVVSVGEMRHPDLLVPGREKSQKWNLKTAFSNPERGIPLIGKNSVMEF
jgi:hypothetical protein